MKARLEEDAAMPHEASSLGYSDADPGIVSEQMKLSPLDESVTPWTPVASVATTSRTASLAWLTVDHFEAFIDDEAGIRNLIA
jgi:hypothetical protein